MRGSRGACVAVGVPQGERGRAAGRYAPCTPVGGVLTLVALGLFGSDASQTVVTGTRSPRSAEDSPVVTQIIPREDLERSPSRLLDELLRTSPVTQTFRRSSSITADPTSQGTDTVEPPLQLRAGLRLTAW